MNVDSTPSPFENVAAQDLDPTAAGAAALDDIDPLAGLRDRFHIPRDESGRRYFTEYIFAKHCT